MTALEQARALGMMAALGAALGGIYDLMGMMRRSRAGVGASDLLFGMLCALGMTLTALYLRMNPFRLYAFAGVALGHGRHMPRRLGRLLRFLAALKRTIAGKSARIVSKKLNNVAEMMNLLQEKMKKGRIMTVQICQKMRGMGGRGRKKKENQAVSDFGGADGRGDAGDADALSGEGREPGASAGAARGGGAGLSTTRRARTISCKTALTEIDSSDFIERTARRDYGYCWYGEIIYQVGNLDEIEQQLDFDVYGQD